jgi:hypothetical protein
MSLKETVTIVPPGKTRVVNLYKEPYTVYIGRGGKGQDGYFGNPFPVGKQCALCDEVHRDGGSTLPCFRLYFFDRLQSDPEFRMRIDGLKGLTLGCFCHPKPCHGDVIAEYLNRNDRLGETERDESVPA